MIRVLELAQAKGFVMENLSKLIFRLEKENIDFAIFYNLSSLTIEPNFFYFSGYDGLGALVVSKENQFLLVPKMEYERARNSRIKSVYIWDKKPLFECIAELTSKNKIQRKSVGIDFGGFTLSAFKGLKKFFNSTKLKDISDLCKDIRVIKTDKEIEYIRKGCIIADNIFKECIKRFRYFSTESEVSAFIEYQINLHGYEISFKPIVASGTNSSMPHHIPRDIKLGSGFCVIDFGIKYNGYCTDMTRTIYIGKPKLYEERIYKLLLNIQKSAIDSVRQGTLCGNIYGDVSRWLGKYKKNFIHGLGHGIGVEIHESPNIKQDSKDVLKNNMVFTIEPGVYFPKRFGIRIEDTIHMKDGMPIILTKSKKDLLLTT